MIRAPSTDRRAPTLFKLTFLSEKLKEANNATR